MNLLEWIFPKICVGCGKFGAYFCPQCLGSMQQTELVCPTCERPAIGGAIHPLCKRKYGLDGLWSLGVYRGSLQQAIKKLKYRFVREIAQTLIDLTLEYWARYTPQLVDEIKKDQGTGWIVVPVPLHPKRERWRGFNQSALLGSLLAKKLGLEYQNLLVRVKQTKPQSELKGKERYQNIKNAFSLSKNHQPRLASGGRGSPKAAPTHNYLLIDDVWTTGVTLQECCYVLKRNGAKKVWALTLAR